MFSTIHEVEAFFNQRRMLGIKPGLERIHELLARLEHPEKKMKAIHVAGTNGKGSTIHFLNEALRANQYDTGIFTSPSFSGLTGHILLNNQAISESELILIMNKIYPHVIAMDNENIAASEFEILTAAAFVFFANKGDIILVETGMGGRFDTTNTFEPILSIITNIALDHIEYLGKTIEEIAYHKAGIIKEQAPVILGEMQQAALQVMIKEAELRETNYFILGKDFHFMQLDKTTQNIEWSNSVETYSLELAMQGEHQLKNVSVVLKALEEIGKLGYQIDWDKALTAISRTNAPGRYEIIHENPTVIIDAAHNPDGIEAFLKTTAAKYPNRKKQVIVAMFKDKDMDEMLHRLSKHFTSITLTSFSHPRAASAKELYDRTDAEEKNKHENWQEAIHKVIQTGELCFVTGSLHFITLVRNYFR